MEVAHPARRDVEGRDAAREHARVVDDAGVGVAVVGGEEVDDRVAAGLLLAVAGEAEVDRELSGARELLRRLEQHVQLALVVDDAARDEVLAVHGRIERAAVPEVERRRRLDVEVAVAEHRGRAAVRGRTDLADGERLSLPVDQLGVAARAADAFADPFARALHVIRVRRVGAHARDAQELGKLVEPGLLHGRTLLAGGDRCTADVGPHGLGAKPRPADPGLPAHRVGRLDRPAGRGAALRSSGRTRAGTRTRTSGRKCSRSASAAPASPTPCAAGSTTD